MEIDKKTYKTNQNNHYQTKYKKKQIILAGSLRANNYHIIHLQNKKQNNHKLWNNFTVSRDGKIFQHFDPIYYSDFMDNKEIDKHSISVVLENMGMVFFDFESNKYLNWIHEECEEHLIYEQNWKNARYWEKYTDKQLDSTAELCKFLCETYKIPLECIGYNVYHENTIKFEGIVSRSNFDMNYNDLNPSFDFKLFFKKIGISYE